jgi:RNA polymerase sigma-70 factor (ECF subfamily)
MTDDERTHEMTLIRSAQTGDLGAFGQLVERHHASVRACLAVRMNNTADSEDLAQETLIVAFKKLPTIDATLPLGPWLRGIALNLLANFRRKFRALPMGLNEDLQALLDSQLAGTFHHGRESEEMHALRECLDEIDGPSRELIRARYADGATLDELAAQLGRKTSAVSMQLFRLRALLSECIERRLASATL